MHPAAKTFEKMILKITNIISKNFATLIEIILLSCHIRKNKTEKEAHGRVNIASGS